MVEIELDVFFDQESLVAALDQLELELEAAARGLSVELFETIVERTPQREGDMVASWTYSLNVEREVNRAGMVPPPAIVPEGEEGETFYRKGSSPGIEVAMRENAGASDGFELGDTVYIVNGVLDGEGYHYGLQVEAGQIVNEEGDTLPLRAVNRPGDAVKRSIDQVERRYSEMSDRSAKRLARKRL